MRETIVKGEMSEVHDVLALAQLCNDCGGDDPNLYDFVRDSGATAADP
jgi:hypothetical protein